MTLAAVPRSESHVSPTLSVIVASGGRTSLERTLGSITPQLLSGDELLVAVQSDCPWGHAARNQMMWSARGDAMLFMDDDDVYVDGALERVRIAVRVAPQVMHLFKMRYSNGHELWHVPEVFCGNVSTQMVVVPTGVVQSSFFSTTPQWGDRYEGDFDFIEQCADRLPVQFHPEVIALVRPL